MIIKKDIVKYKKNKDNEQIPVYDYVLNKKFWMDVKKPISIILDETDQFLNARNAMSKTNKIMNQWISMIRRVIGASDVNSELILITQLTRKMDVVAREMAHKIVYFVCHYYKKCKKCGTTYQESSETSEKMEVCIYCGHYAFLENNHTIQVMHFKNIESFESWKDFKSKTFHMNYLVHDIDNYFKFYNSLQWDDLFNDYY